MSAKDSMPKQHNMCGCLLECDCDAHTVLKERFVPARPLEVQDPNATSTVSYPRKTNDRVESAPSDMLPEQRFSDMLPPGDIDPRDKQRFQKQALKKESDFVYVNCALVRCFFNLLESVLLQNDALDAENQIKDIHEQMLTEDVQAELRAWYRDQRSPNWLVDPKCKILLMLLDQPLGKTCLKKRRERLVREKRTKKREDQLWSTTLRLALQESLEDDDKNARYGDNTDDDTGENENPQYRRTSGETLTRGEPTDSTKLSGMMTRGLGNLAAVIEESNK